MRLNLEFTRVFGNLLHHVVLTEDDRQALERMAEGPRASDLAVQAVSSNPGQELVLRIKEPFQQSFTDIADRLERCDWDLGFLSGIEHLDDIEHFLRPTVEGRLCEYRSYGWDTPYLSAAFHRLHECSADYQDYVSRAYALKLRLRELEGKPIRRQ